MREQRVQLLVARFQPLDHPRIDHTVACLFQRILLRDPHRGYAADLCKLVRLNLRADHLSRPERHRLGVNSALVQAHFEEHPLECYGDLGLVALRDQSEPAAAGAVRGRERRLARLARPVDQCHRRVLHGLFKRPGSEARERVIGGHPRIEMCRLADCDALASTGCAASGFRGCGCAPPRRRPPGITVAACLRPSPRAPCARHPRRGGLWSWSSCLRWARVGGARLDPSMSAAKTRVLRLLCGGRQNVRRQPMHGQWRRADGHRSSRPTHHPRLPRPAPCEPSGSRPNRLGCSLCSRASVSGIVNQRPLGARGLSMRGETIRERDREGRTGSRSRHSAGPPGETSAHATPCFQ